MQVIRYTTKILCADYFVREIGEQWFDRTKQAIFCDISIFEIYKHILQLIFPINSSSYSNQHEKVYNVSINIIQQPEVKEQ